MSSRPEDTANERPPGRPASRPPQGEGGADSVDRSAADAPAATEEDERQQRIGYIGKRLGRFLISAELGRGGMATVYRARDPQVGRDVAVKVMHGFFAGRAEIEARFRREANAVAAIKHPSILALYDFAPPVGEEPGYIVSELIEGPGLRQVVEEHGGRLTPEVAGLITLRVAEALGAAHAGGIVHRDVKPDNVLIDRAGGGARVVLTDFGVAHVSGMDTMTATGAVLGSPAYMSPEQARGEDVGPASDVFSLGVLMYQLCTGHLPFSGKDPLNVITAILRGEFQRPQRLEARVGPEWEAVIMRCLDRDPARRFANGGAVAQALRDLLSASGLADEQASLRRYLIDPAAFECEMAPLIARLATAAAEQARRRGQIPRALAEVGRALAYAPDDTTARDLLDRLSARHKRVWVRVGLAGAAAIALTGSVLVWGDGKPAPGRITPLPSSATAIRAASVQRVTPAASVGALPNAQPPVVAAAPHAAAAPPLVAPPLAAPTVRGEDSSAADQGPRRARAKAATALALRDARGATRNRGKRSAADAAPSRDSDSGGGKPQLTVAEEFPPAELPSSPVVATQTASVVLRASHGFCEPSLDAHPPSLRASYNNLTPGPHDIYCSLPQHGEKVHVATYDLRPGTRPSLTIVPGPDGRPVLGRPE